MAAQLTKDFSQVGFYHAGLSTEKRNSVQQAYASGELRILVATNAFGMGIDQPDVRLVVHYNMPANLDALSQEMGRAGRDGQPSTCLLLYSGKDKGLQSFFIQSSEASAEIKSLRWRNLDTLLHYAEGSECRHAEILTYYRDAQRLKKCGHCDSCEPQSPRRIFVQHPIQVRASAILHQAVGQVMNQSMNLAKTRLKKKIKAEDEALTAQQMQMFEKLKVWRRQKAGEMDVPAFIIFGDKTLRQIAIHQPQSLDEMDKIYGIGPDKREKFGSELLAQIQNS